MNRFFGKGRNAVTVSSLLNTFGMAAAFAALYVILVQVRYDLNYNRSVRDAERVYLCSSPSWSHEGSYMTNLSRPPLETVIRELPGIESGGLLEESWTLSCFVRRAGDGDRFSGRAGEMHVSRATEGVLNTLGIRFLRGSWSDLAGRETEFALSESTARRLGVDVGDAFEVLNNSGGRFRCHVAAVFADMPAESDFAELDSFYDIGDENLHEWGNWNYPFYIKLYPGVDPEEIERASAEVVARFKPGGWDGLKLRLTALPDTYFDTVLLDSGQRGNPTTTLTFIAVGLLVLLICFINFVNFFFALVPVRMRAVNTRRVLGASRGSLVLAFVGEAVLSALLASLLAGVLVHLFRLSAYAELISCSVAFSEHAGLALLTLLGVLALSAAVSVYPALYATSFTPAFALKGAFGASVQGQRLRYGLIGLQFVVSIALVICSAVIRQQRGYMMRYDMGFDRENLLVARAYNVAPETEDVIAGRLKSDPDIRDVSWANGEIIAPGRMTWGRLFKGEQIYYQVYPVSWNFLRFMGIGITEGRDFTENDRLQENGVYIFNETARRQFDLTLEDRMDGHRGPTEIAGFCRDFNFMPLSNGIEPFCFYLYGRQPWQYNGTLFVRTAAGADLPAVFAHIRSVLHEFNPAADPEDIDVRFFDDSLQRHYLKEVRLSRFISLSTLLAIIISLMGVFGLVMFEAEYRRKEIGVRRVSGASVAGILAMFNARFVKIVLVCFLLAAPLSLYIVTRWLERFAYRVPVSGWIFVGALASVLAVTVAVVSLRSYGAASANPVDSLKNE